MLRAPAAVVHRSKPPSPLEIEGFSRFRLNGSRSFSLRRAVRTRAAAPPDQLFRLGDRDPASHRFSVRGLARRFLHYRPARASGQLPDSEEAAQGRAAETF